jgi:hypothetical protein
MVRFVCMPKASPPSGSAARQEREETQRVSERLGPAGLDHGLRLRASAQSRFGCFGLEG